MSSPFISVQDDPNMPLCIQMHTSMWTEEFEKFTCRDLCAGGKLYENPDLINTSDRIKDRIRNGQFTVIPVEPERLLKGGNSLTGYICVYDTQDGMRIHHTWEDIRKSKEKNKK